MPKPISLAPWPQKAVVAKEPVTESKDPPRQLETSEIEAILATIERIHAVWPISRTNIMRALGKNTSHFSWYFEPKTRRATSDKFELLLALFDCKTAEDFFALDPAKTAGLEELIRRKELNQYVWKKQA